MVSLDLDGTLVEYHKPFVQFCEIYFDRKLPHWQSYDGSLDFEEFLGLTRPAYREAKLAYRQGGFKRWAPEYPEATRTAEGLRDSGAEIWIATTRPWQSLGNIDPDTRQWLDRHGLAVDGLLYGDNKYEQLLQHVELERVVGVVDDLSEQFDIATGLGLPAILIRRNHNLHHALERNPQADSLREIYLELQVRIANWKEQHAHAHHS